MPRTKSGSLPSYRLYKRTGQAVVTLNGRDHYLGEHGTATSREKYARLIAEWLDHQRISVDANCRGLKRDLTVPELILAYVRHALDYYRDSPKEIEKIRLSLRPLRRLYSSLSAGDFGPLALRAVQAEMCRSLARGTVNMRIGVIKRMFRWAAGRELVPASVYEGLRAVDGLRRGRSPARETTAVRPVDDAQVELVLPLVSRPVRAMIELQRLTGMRSGEVCQMRACDIDKSGDVWTYRPERHKTAYRGKERLVFLGPRAQQVLTR
jgi:integrase